MTEPIYIDPATDEGRRRTAAALAASGGCSPTATLRCSKCGRALAHVGQTPAGPLFTSSWKVESALDFRVTQNGRELSRRQSVARRDEMLPIVQESGPPLAGADVDGVIAHLALPPGCEDYPALLVRCDRHGDTVLPLAQARAALSGPKDQVVEVSKPFTDYAYHDPGGAWLPVAQSVHSSETRRLRSDPPRPPERG